MGTNLAADTRNPKDNDRSDREAHSRGGKDEEDGCGVGQQGRGRGASGIRKEYRPGHMTAQKAEFGRGRFGRGIPTPEASRGPCIKSSYQELSASKSYGGQVCNHLGIRRARRANVHQSREHKALAPPVKYTTRSRKLVYIMNSFIHVKTTQNPINQQQQ